MIQTASGRKSNKIDIKLLLLSLCNRFDELVATHANEIVSRDAEIRALDAAVQVRHFSSNDPSYDDRAQGSNTNIRSDPY